MLPHVRPADTRLARDDRVLTDMWLALRRKKAQSPIITVPVPGSRMYLCKSPDVAAMVHRKASTLTFAHVVEFQVKPTCGVPDEVWKALNPDGDPKMPVSMATHRSHHANMRPDRLAGMHERAFEIIERHLNGSLGNCDRKRIDLLGWLREILTLSSASALYGKENPIAWDHTLVEELE
jgi:hypothetical protein